ncbi:hypothetical protein [Methanolobus sp.]|nr:hypothetical protein [Methanolobus sp.]
MPYESSISIADNLLREDTPEEILKKIPGIGTYGHQILRLCFIK